MEARCRTCVGCRTRAHKAQLLRFVADGRGRVTLDPLQRAAGRGVYVCPEGTCLARACRGGFARGLRRRVAAGDAAALRSTVVAGLEGALASELARGVVDGRVRRAGVAGAPVGAVVDGQGIEVLEQRLREQVAALRRKLQRLGHE